MFSKEANLLQQIADSREAIRQKHLQLKHGIEQTENEVNQVFKPIIEPLNKIVNARSEKKDHIIKVSPRKSMKHSTPFKKINYDDDDDSNFQTITNSQDFENESSIDVMNNNGLNTLEYTDIIGNHGSDTNFGVRKKHGLYMIGCEPTKF